MADLVFCLDDEVGIVRRWWNGWTVAMLEGGKSEFGVEGRDEEAGEADEMPGGRNRSGPTMRSR